MTSLVGGVQLHRAAYERELHNDENVINAWKEYEVKKKRAWNAACAEWSAPKNREEEYDRLMKNVKKPSETRPPTLHPWLILRNAFLWPVVLPILAALCSGTNKAKKEKKAIADAREAMQILRKHAKDDPQALEAIDCYEKNQLDLSDEPVAQLT